MKIREDFVTNSSSSSFIISKDDITDEQLEAIRLHSEFGKLLGIEYAEEAWEISENEGFISGYTYMDNYNVGTLFTVIGVNNVVWSDYNVSLPKSKEEFNKLLDREDTRHESVNWQSELARLKTRLAYIEKVKAKRRGDYNED